LRTLGTESAATLVVYDKFESWRGLTVRVLKSPVLSALGFLGMRQTEANPGSVKRSFLSRYSLVL